MARKTGRRTKLTAALQEAIVNAVAGGIPFMRAVSLAGIAEQTAKEWRARGDGTSARPNAPVYATFAAAIKKAEAQDEARRILRINQAGQGGSVLYEKTTTHPDGHVVTEVKRAAPEWTADAWHLERSRPDDWGRRDRIDLRVTVQRLATKIAEDLGMTSTDVLTEAEAILAELDG